VVAEQGGKATSAVEGGYCYGTSGSLLYQSGQIVSDAPDCPQVIRQVSADLFQAHTMFRNTTQNEKWYCLLLPSGKMPLANGFIIFIISCLICFTFLTGTIAKT